MNKLLVGLVLSIGSALAQADLQVQVEPSQVSTNDTFKIILTQDNPQQSGLPNLTTLQKDFYILSTERSVNYTVLNGQAQSMSQWIVSVKAKKAGVVTIPAITIGADQSTPLTINVENGTKVQELPANAAQQEGIFIDTMVNVEKPYVNQQIVYTIKLYASEQLLDAKYQGPQVADALLFPLGDEKRYQTVKNNTNYMVSEQSYAIFPQKSGTLKITSPIFTALVYDFNPQQIQAQDKPKNLTVQPIPAQYTGKEWLPAKQIKLTDSYENSNQSFSQGSTLIRTITINGVAIPAQLLPPLAFPENDSFKVYTEKGIDDNVVKQGELISTTEIKVTYLFDKAGKITIPELRLPWFNTQTGKEEFATLPARTLEVTASGTGTTTNNPPPVAVTKNDSNKEQAPLLPEEPTKSFTNWAWLVAAVFALAWVITLFLMFWQRRSRDSSRGQYKKSLLELAQACRQADPKLARDALLKWGSLHWPDAPMLNLTDLTRLVRDAHLNKQLHILSQVLYGRGDRALWRGDELLRAVNSVKRSRSRSSKKNKTKVLPPINPF